MIITARDPTGHLVPTAPFTTRGINLAPAKISELNIFSKPKKTQIAYGDYEKNIEAFTYATSIKEKVLLGLRNYPFNNNYIPTVPLGLPRTVFSIDEKKNIPPATREVLNRAMKVMEGSVRDLGGKAGTIYLIDKPKFTAIRSTLPPIMSMRPPTITGYASAPASLAATTILQFIDAFLATQTYEYKGEDATDYLNTRESIGSKRVAPSLQRGNAKKTKGKKVASTSKGGQMEVDDDDAPIEGIDPAVLGMTATAKFSPLPSSVNWGPVAEVPNKPGIFFPYFDGLVVPDLAAFREFSIDLFFNNLPGENRHIAWKNYRDLLPSLVESTKAQEYLHVLLGCKLALQGQARPFLIFEDGCYQGFVLLGEHFSVYTGSVEHTPISHDKLREELQSIMTKEQSVQAIVEVMEKMGIDVTNINGEGKNTCVEIANRLMGIDEKREDIKEELASLAKHLGNWVSRMKFERVTPAAVISTTYAILQRAAGDIVPIIPSEFYIPLKNWGSMNKPFYPYLAAHGPTSFSFRNAKGEEFRLNPLTKRYDIPRALTKEEKASGAKKDKQFFIFAYEKPTGICANDWKKMFELGSIRQDGSERAAPNKAIVITKPADVTSLLGVFSTWSERVFPKPGEEKANGIDLFAFATETAGVTVDESGGLVLNFDFLEDEGEAQEPAAMVE